MLKVFANFEIGDVQFKETNVWAPLLILSVAGNGFSTCFFLFFLHIWCN